MHGIAAGGFPGEENQPGKDQQIQQQAESKQTLAQPEQAVCVRILTQSAFQVQPKTTADPPVRQGQQKNKGRNKQRDQQVHLQTVYIHYRASFVTSAPGGSMDGTVRFRGSSEGRPLR